MSDEKQEKAMTDQNPMRIAEEMRAKRAAAYEGEWYPNFFSSPRGARSYWCVGVRGKGSQQVARAVNSEREADFIAYAASNAIALADALEEERKHSSKLTELLESCMRRGSRAYFERIYKEARALIDERRKP